MKAQMFNYNFWINETDKTKLKEYYNKVLIDSGFGIIGFIDYSFTPYGYSALWVLSESHFAIHTFPEAGKTYLELTSCVKQPFDLFKKNNSTEIAP